MAHPTLELLSSLFGIIAHLRALQRDYTKLGKRDYEPPLKQTLTLLREGGAEQNRVLLDNDNSHCLTV